ncbi:hypothetical protein LAZ67_20001333 [Cordylochernes scorpioides]|uniref:Uncharacterized protein n=1 Tax=Cordylochernes scorpioides TaxID=51811 RepID=A0ABY6LLK4_9ARAC|nr:hypothetical protein LAZ67_20001333 [Cordylochernes scorpioides]
MKHGALFLIHKPQNNHLNGTHKVLLVRIKFVLTSPKKKRFSSSSEVIENVTVELNKLRKIDFELAFQQLFSR